MADVLLSHPRWRLVGRWFLVLAFAAAGYLHVTKPAPFLGITPGWVPHPEFVVWATGWCEMAGAVGLAQGVWPWLRRLAGWALAAYALCVWPANINHLLMDMARADHGLGWAYHGPRMVLQPVLIWLALWVSGAVDWPFAKRRG